MNISSDYKYLYTIIYNRLANRVLTKVKEKLMESKVLKCMGCGQLMMFFPKQIDYFYCKDCREKLQNVESLHITFDVPPERDKDVKM